MDCLWRSPSLIFTKSCQIRKLRSTSTQIRSTVPTACKGYGKNCQIRDSSSATLDWIQLAPTGLTRFLGRATLKCAPTIHSLHEQVFACRSRRAMEIYKCWHLGWAGFPCVHWLPAFILQCLTLQIFHGSSLQTVTMVDWCSNFLQWVYWARDSRASLPCQSEPMTFRMERSIKFMSKQLQTGINRFATGTTTTPWCFPLSHYDLRHGDRHWVILTTIQALNSDYPSPPSRFNSYLCRSIIDAWPFSHGSETCVLSTLQNAYNIAHWIIGILTLQWLIIIQPKQWLFTVNRRLYCPLSGQYNLLFTVNNHCFGCY